MRCDPVLPAQIDRARKKLALHDAETFLDLPALLVDGYDLSRFIFKICADCVKTIIAFFFRDPGAVKVAYSTGCGISVRGTVIGTDEALVIILPGIKRLRGSDSGLCPFDLPAPDPTLVVPPF